MGGLPGADPVGGSRALAEGLTDYPEEIYLDLIEYHHGFNVAAWLAGQMPWVPPAAVNAMLRDLPRGSRLQARTYGMRKPEDEMSDEEKSEAEQVDWYAERRMWTDDRMLLAAAVNKLDQLVAFVPQWEKNKGPKPSPIGPAEWRGISEEPAKPATVDDVMRKVFGWAG